MWKLTLQKRSSPTPLYRYVSMHASLALFLDRLLVSNSLRIPWVYERQGKYEQAEPLYQHALSIREQIFGPHHPRTRIIRENFVSLLRAMGREEQAIQEEMRDQGAIPPS